MVVVSVLGGELHAVVFQQGVAYRVRTHTHAHTRAHTHRKKQWARRERGINLLNNCDADMLSHTLYGQKYVDT